MSTRITAFFLLVVALLATESTIAQTAEVQVYPAGVIGVIGLDKQVNDRTTGRVFAGINITDRRDWGEQDDETGHGFGLGVSMDRTLSADSRLWFGTRIDLWSMAIDWTNDTLNIEGETDIWVLQPTVRAGYRLTSTLDLSASLGAEINVSTDGEPVGEGAILLVGLRWTR